MHYFYRAREHRPLEGGGGGSKVLCFNIEYGGFLLYKLV